MGRPRATPHGVGTDTTSGSPPATTQHGSSSYDLYPEVAPEDASRRAAGRKKSLTSSRDQLLYLQALYPYAAYEELIAVIGSTDGADEAARRAYGALNPDYTGYAYLKEQNDLQSDAKLPRSRRNSAFAGIKESVEGRAADVLRPGIYTNLSQLHEYHDTVGLFVVDTSDWDRATLLPSRDLAEVAFMELPLREDPPRGDGDDSDDAEEGGRNERRSRATIVAIPRINSSVAFMDARPTSMPSVCSNAASPSQSGARTGNGSRAHSSRAVEEARVALPPQDLADGGVVYLQNSDPPCCAPIIAWAPEAIRVGPAQARREREGALRVFDEATFFKAPLLQEAVPPAPGNRSTVQLDLPSVPVDTAGNSLLLPPPPRPARSPPLTEWAARYAAEAVCTSDHEPFELDAMAYLQRGTTADGRTAEVFSAEEPLAERAPQRLRSTMPTPRPEARVSVGDSAGDVRRDSGDTAESSAATVQTQQSLRDAARESLKKRNPHPLTTSEKVRQRMRSLTPVGNLVFRETSLLHTPHASMQHDKESCRRPSTAGGGDDPSASSVTTHDTQRRSSADAGDSGAGAAGAVHGSAGDADDVHAEPLTIPNTAAIPAAHSGCSSLDPAAFLNAEEERWNMIVRMLTPYEEVFGTKFRCELVRCIYEESPKLRANVTLILQRLLSVLGKVLRGKQLVEGITEEPLDLPLFGPILLTTSPVKLAELTFREHKCAVSFCEEGTRLRVKLNLKRMELEPIQFAYIGEAEAARQARLVRQAQRSAGEPRTRAAAYSLRTRLKEHYTEGVTSGTATVTASDVRVEGVGYMWLMATGKTHVAFQKVNVSVGAFSVSTTVTKLNVLCTLGAPILRLIVQRTIAEALRGAHTF